MSGESFKLKGGQKFTVYDLPSEATYKLEEVPAAGYTQTSAQNAEGAIRAGRTQEAVFTNTYHAQGNAQLRAIKTLTGHKLNRNQFRFDVTDKTEGSETYGEIIRSAGNDVPTSTQQDENSGVITSQAPVAFGQIRYTEADAGKTFTYEITEQNTGKDGYTYSTEVKTVIVKVEDLTGDGNLTVTVTPDLGSDDAYNFNNTYKAEGEISFKAWKVLEIYDLEKDQFEFELYKYDPNTKDKVGEPLQTAKNNEDGTINFAPIKFTQDDVNVDPNNPNIYWYLLREKRGSDPAVVYSNKEYIIKITPYDNNDGTISFSQDDQQVERQYEEADCPDCGGTGLKPGGAISHIWSTRNIKDIGKTGTAKIALSSLKNVDEWLCDNCHGMCYVGGDICPVCMGSGILIGKPMEFSSITYQITDYVKVPDSDRYAVKDNNGSSVWYNAIVIEDQLCPTCHGDGGLLIEGGITVTGETTGPVFVNGYHDGNLSVSKLVTAGDQNQEFKFHIQLAGEKLTDGKVEYELSQVDNGSTIINAASALKANAPMLKSVSSKGGAVTEINEDGIYPVQQVYHATPAELEGEAYAMLDTSTGVFTFFRSDPNNLRDPDNNPFQTTNNHIWIRGTKKYYSNVENMGNGKSDYWRGTDWASIKHVQMVNAIKPQSTYFWFRNCPNLETVDLHLLDTSICTNFDDMFSKGINGTFKLKVLDVSNFDMRNAQSVQWMFGGDGSVGSTTTSQNDLPFEVLILGDFEIPSNVKATHLFAGTNSLKVLVRGSTPIKGNNNNINYNDPPISSPDADPYYDGKWHKLGSSEAGVTFKELIAGSGEAFAGAWYWSVPFEAYNISFDGGEGGGSMAKVQSVNRNEDYTFVPAYYWFGHKITSFVDKNDPTKVFEVDTDGIVTIPKQNYNNGDDITLVAQWEKIDTSAIMNSGRIDFTLHGGEMATFKDIPAGTAYEVWEETPEGWILIKKVDDSGVIEPLKTAEAEFTNEYNPNKATVSLTASKRFDGRLSDKPFTFELYQIDENAGRTLLQRITNNEGGIASFDILTYGLEDKEEHHYVIVEVPGTDDTIEYDTHEEFVDVTVEDNGKGVLTAKSNYHLADGEKSNGVFVNSTKPGDLKLSKTIEKASPKAAEQEFTFKVSFLDRFEQPTKLLEGGTTEKTTVTALNSNGTEATLDIVDNSVTVTLRGGETVTLKDIPAGIHYKVEELNIPVGWAKTGESGTTGEIRSTETSSAAFTNTYTAAGRVYLEVVKELLGSVPKADSFTFELYAEQDWDEDENAPKAGAKPLDTQKNAAPDMREEIADPNSSERGATIPNPDYGKAIAHFNAVNFTEADVGKAFHYYIREVPGTDSQIVYTKETRKVTVTVTDETGEGRLTATPDYSETAKPTLTNSYKPGSLEVSKHLLKSTAETKDKVFTFTVRLEDASGTPLTGTFQTIKEWNEERETGTANAENGKLVFTLRDGESILISGLPDGSGYRIEEAEETGFILSGKTGEEGTIVANETQHAVFRNTYDATGELKLSVGKRLLIGATQEETKLEAAQFSFTLRNQDGQALQQKYNDERGRAVFDPIELTLDDIGTSSYTITENNYGVDGINYDDSKIRADVTVKDDGQGQLKAEVEYTRIIPDRNGGDPAEEKIPESEVEFINRKVKNGKCAIRVEKTLEGQKLKARRFKFELVDERGNVIATRYNNSAGQTIFDPDSIPALRFDTIDMEGKKEKQFNFVVREVNDGLKGMQYAEPVPICLTVTEDESAVLKVNGQENPVLKAEFHNAYQAETEIVLEAEKQYLGGTLKEGDFLFELLEGGKVIAAASNDAQGKVRFNLKYTIRDVDPDTHRGEKRYVMRESVPEKRGNIRYDTHEESIIVSLVDNENGEMMASSNREGETIKFINECRKPNRYYFSFRKVWKDAPAEGLQFTLYNSDGTVHVHGFNKTVLNDREWLFEAWLDKPDDYYVIEEVPDGFSAAYDNAGNHADETDRCYNGGTIVNSRVPDTGDRSHAGLWVAVLTCSAALLVLLVRKKR